MAEKSRHIIQCPFCDSNRLYFRRGLVSDVLFSLLTPVRSYTCGSCSRTFRKYGNYFTSKQAMIHIFGLLAVLAFINPDLLLPENWLLNEDKPQQEARIEQEQPATEEIPLLSMAIANATNSSFVVENGTISLVEVNISNTTVPVTDDEPEDAGNTEPVTASSRTILSFNSTEIAGSPSNASSVKPAATPQEITRQALQEGKLKSIYFKDLEGKTRIELDLGGSPLSYTSFFLRDPDRLVVDINGNWEYYGPTTLRPENPVFSRFRIGIYADKIRMVMDLKGQTPAPVIMKTDHGLNIDVK
ncbi:AMIN domain-containing protein [Maridesulfovibrio sp. FT414]|uniref:AMIN domain-containing protein n=1 Tax=Maridesulfovibrio sp. FT414 TaxID=2979469 RepID=UPI003D8091C5